MADRDEAALIARVRAGDRSGFEDLIRPYEGRVYQAVLRITRNPTDAADVYQTAIMTAFEKLDGFRGDAAFGTWLYQIAVNAALMQRRAAARNPVVERHFRGCPDCQAFSKTYQEVVRLSGELGSDDIPEEVRERVRAALRERFVRS